MNQYLLRLMEGTDQVLKDLMTTPSHGTDDDNEKNENITDTPE